MSRKIQKLRMLREGQRKSPRISALDVCKAQRSPKSDVVVTQQQQSSCTSNSRKNATLKHKKELHHAVDLAEGYCESEGPAKRKRKLKPLQDVASNSSNASKDSKPSGVQDDEQQNHEPVHWAPHEHIGPSSSSAKQKGQTTSPGSLNILSASWLPEKRILELIIDILQRKDSNEIFGEPVDPDEVEDYYAIIKEPMDFGTMRAKLHEGMYENLAQFEHDIFLITGNAMHFNNTGTIYFRQARAIDDLAKKVFYALKTDPENFEMEFSVTRRRSGRRRLQAEARNAICNFSNKPVTNPKSYSRQHHSSPKRMDSSTNGLSVLRKSRLNSSCSVTATSRSDSGDHGLLFGRTSSEADRRSSYKPLMPLLSDKHSTTPTSWNDSKLLVHVNQQDLGYRKSLMLFAKDLGPTAQMIAKRKITQCSAGTAIFLSPGYASGTSNYPNYTALTSMQGNYPTQETSTVSSGKSSWNNQIEMGISDKGKGTWPCNGADDTSVEVPSKDNASGRFCVFEQEYGSSALDITSVGRIGKFQKSLDSVGEGFLTSATSDARNFNLSFCELTSQDERSTSLKPNKSKTDNESSSSELARGNYSQLKLQENLNFPPSSCTGIFTREQKIGYTDNLNSLLAQSHHPISADGGTNNEVGLCERGQGLKSSEDWKPVSNFTFEQPFVMNKLDGKNPMRQNSIIEKHSVSGSWNAVVERPCYSSMNYSDNKQSNLVLRL